MGDGGRVPVDVPMFGVHCYMLHLSGSVLIGSHARVHQATQPSVHIGLSPHGTPHPHRHHARVVYHRRPTHCHRRHHCPSRQADPPGLLAGHADRPRRHRKVPRRGKSIAAGATGARVGVGVLDHQRAGTARERHRAVERRARHERGLPSVVPHKGAALGLAVLLPHQEDFHQRAKRGEDGLEVRLGGVEWHHPDEEFVPSAAIRLRRRTAGRKTRPAM
mmetsp:Transcript_5222/g.17342  ORF Transcript_5222/g.17342 Transcript_5222/m.17342 type:complete len:219 (-) Transcript_5222:662-1318(-)